jgi:5-(aminomethyl)-3-furanmethanol phosphate kinase
MISSVGPARVLKLGGSLATSGRLTGILDLVVATRRNVVVVPGGGPFADAVRIAQPEFMITERLAHTLALLAMHQMGLVIASRHVRFTPCDTLADIAAALGAGQLPVWMPFALQSHDETLPNDWTTTSDALAARLAERMLGVPVALVKSCAVPPAVTLAQLTTSGITDATFPVIVERARLAWHVFGTTNEPELAAWLGL